MKYTKNKTNKKILKCSFNLTANFFCLLFLSSCGDKVGASGPNIGGLIPREDGVPNGPVIDAPTGSNVMAITVNGSFCSSNSYVNKPCVSLTLCTTDGATCRTIDDILLDTGSYGLRVFTEALSGMTLTQATSGAANLAECVAFADGSTDWGPVKLARITLGGEDPVTVPIQEIDSTFVGSSNCGSSPDTSAAQAGFNGILGIGLFKEDCGSGCVSNSANGRYFACSGASCVGATVPLASQVQNPIFSLATNNNGVLMRFPSVPLGGLTDVTGYMIFGIGTASNNSPSGVTAFASSPDSLEFTTTFDGSENTGFIDSGSNGLFFPGPASGVLADCALTDTDYAGWYCPSSTQTFTATNTSFDGSPSGNVSFRIGNFFNIFQSGNAVFVENGGEIGSFFDWGLPFYFGRNIYHGYEDKSSSLGSGAFWAY